MTIYFSSGTYVNGTTESTSIHCRSTSGSKSNPPGTSGSSGIVGHTLAPVGAFSVSLDNNQMPYTGSSGSTIVFLSTEFNYNSWYSTSTGRFTPQKAGVYWFGTVMMADNNTTHRNKYYRVCKNGSTGSSLAYNNYFAYTTSDGVHHKNNFGQSIFYLNGSSDYVSVHVGSTNYLYMNSILYTRFFGCYLSAT